MRGNGGIIIRIKRRTRIKTGSNATLSTTNLTISHRRLELGVSGMKPLFDRLSYLYILRNNVPHKIKNVMCGAHITNDRDGKCI